MNTPPRSIASYYAGDSQPDSTLSESQPESHRWTLAAILEEFREAARSKRHRGKN